MQVPLDCLHRQSCCPIWKLVYLFLYNLHIFISFHWLIAPARIFITRFSRSVKKILLPFSQWKIFVIFSLCLMWDVIMAMCFVFFFRLLLWWVTLISFQILSRPCIPRIDPRWLCYVNPFIYFHIYFFKTYWGVFVSKFMKDIGLWLFFPFCFVFV